MTDATDTTLKTQVAPTAEELAKAMDECIAGDRAFTLELAAHLRDALRNKAPSPAGAPISMIYRNWRGEVAPREIVPTHLHFGSTDWHPEPGWLLGAYDLEKKAHRDFALADCQFADLTGGEIRQLEWKTYPDTEIWFAETPFGLYVIETTGESWAFAGRAADGSNAEAEGKTGDVDAAKVAAQRDFEVRVRTYFSKAKTPAAGQEGGVS